MEEKDVRPENVDILNMVKTTLYPRPNEPHPVTLVTYSYAGLVPSVVTVAGHEPTDREIFEAIKADVLKRRETPTRKLKL